MTAFPSTSRVSFGRPMRRARPAASTRAVIMPATLRSRALHRRFERAPGKDTAQMRFVLDGPLEIGLDVDAIGGLLGRCLDRRRVKRLGLEPGFDTLRADGLRASPRHADTGFRACA